jgi:hypothetical protein
MRDVDVCSFPGGCARPSAVRVPHRIALLAPLNVREDCFVHEPPLDSRSRCCAHTQNAITRSGQWRTEDTALIVAVTRALRIWAFPSR